MQGLLDVADSMAIQQNSALQNMDGFANVRGAAVPHLFCRTPLERHAEVCELKPSCMQAVQHMNGLSIDSNLNLTSITNAFLVGLSAHSPGCFENQQILADESNHLCTPELHRR